MENNSPKKQKTQPVIDPDKLNEDDWFLGVRQLGDKLAYTSDKSVSVKDPKTGKYNRPSYTKRKKIMANFYLEPENIQVWRGIRNKSQFCNLALKQSIGIMYWALQQYKDPETYKSRGPDAPPEHFGGVKPEHIIQVFNETYPVPVNTEKMIARKREVVNSDHTKPLEPREAVTWHETSHNDENDNTEPVNAQKPTEHNLDAEFQPDNLTTTEPTEPTRLRLI